MPFIPDLGCNNIISRMKKGSNIEGLKIPVFQVTLAGPRDTCFPFTNNLYLLSAET
jgi:hypothetical protein